MVSWRQPPGDDRCRPGSEPENIGLRARRESLVLKGSRPPIIVAVKGETANLLIETIHRVGNKVVMCMAKVVRIQDRRLAREIQDAEYLEIDGRRFLLVEVESQDTDEYEVTDPDEIRAVEEALGDTSPLLDNEEALRYVKTKLREHGLG